MTSKNNRAPLLYLIKLCASFQTHWWIQTAVTVQKRSIWVKICDFLSCVTLKFNGWSWQTIGHLFCATSSFVTHFKAIGEFKLEWQSGNTQFGSKSMILLAVWPWNLTDDLENQYDKAPKQYEALCIISSQYMKSNWSYGPEMANLGFDLCNLDFWPLTLHFA